MRLLTSISLVLLFSVYSCCSVFSQTAPFNPETYVSADGDSLKYRLLVPDYAKNMRYPLVIFLHGSGERGNDNEAQLKWGVQNFATDQNIKQFPAIVFAPQCPERMSWANTDNDKLTLESTPSTPMRLTMEALTELKQKLPIDTNRIYITGVSMGGKGAYDALMRWPDVFAAAVPVCGWGDVSKAVAIAHIPIWIFHGANDEVVDPKRSQHMVKALTEAGAQPGFTQYPEVGHFAWIAAYSDPMMMAWLFRQNKGE